MEISANELRIGNIVSHHGFIRKIEAIHPKNKLTDKHRRIEFENGVNDFLMNLISVELTEEWLINFGFKNNKLGFFKVKKIVDDIGYHIYFIRRYLKEVQYVHELQNLYFELIREELKINE
jgi:hypothetical protein